MRVAVARIDPVGAFMVFENGEFQTGDYCVDRVRGQLARDHDVVSLGEMLPLLDVSTICPVRESYRFSGSSFDPRVPSLLEELKQGPADWHQKMRHALLLDGYQETVPNEPGILRRMYKTFSTPGDGYLALRLEESDGDWRLWQGFAEISLGDRGFFRMELHPRMIDRDEQTHVQMLNQFIVELYEWSAAWGQRESPGLAEQSFTIVIDRTWIEDRGVVEKGCVAFHVEGDPDAHAVERAVLKAESDETTTMEEYDPLTKRGSWYMVDATSEFKPGDRIPVGLKPQSREKGINVGST